MHHQPQKFAETEMLDLISDPEEAAKAVAAAYRTVGYLIDGDSDAALLADPLCKDCPIVGVSKGFSDITHFPREALIGKNCRILLEGVPDVAISKSARKNLRDYCGMCRLRSLQHISEQITVQPNARLDGTKFLNLFMVGLCVVRGHPYILGVQASVGEGMLVKLSKGEVQKLTEVSRATIQRLRRYLSNATLAGGNPQPKDAVLCNVGFTGADFGLFSGRLQDHCLILTDGRTVMRREPHEIATNCMVFGDTPVRKTEVGLYFEILVNDVVSNFEGLPVLGYTRRKPVDSPDLYPTVTKGLGQSVLIGGFGEAFARDQYDHFVMGFKLPGEKEIQNWSLAPETPSHRRKPPVNVQPGDKIGCMYTHEGLLQLYRNGEKVMDVDTKRPIQDCDYYAVVDVCFSPYSLTLLPTQSQKDEVEPEPPTNAEPSDNGSSFMNGVTPVSVLDIDRLVSMVVNGPMLKKAMSDVVSEITDFCVTIAEPAVDDVPLIAVSPGFEAMTGYSHDEIIGLNCRFLNDGCSISPMDLAGLRLSSETGVPFTGLIPNRKKSGEFFVNLLDLRGLVIATDTQTDQNVWFLIGIQADVTGICDDGIPEDHLHLFQDVAAKIRESLIRELSVLAAHSAFEQATPMSSKMCSLDGHIKLLKEPVWIEPQSHPGLMQLTSMMSPGSMPKVLGSEDVAGIAGAGEASAGNGAGCPSTGDREKHYNKFEEAYHRQCQAKMRSVNSTLALGVPRWLGASLPLVTCAFMLGMFLGGRRLRWSMPKWWPSWLVA